MKNKLKLIQRWNRKTSIISAATDFDFTEITCVIENERGKVVISETDVSYYLAELQNFKAFFNIPDSEV